MLFSDDGEEGDMAVDEQAPENEERIRKKKKVINDIYIYYYTLIFFKSTSTFLLKFEKFT
jgi:hypothetical protein